MRQGWYRYLSVIGGMLCRDPRRSHMFRVADARHPRGGWLPSMLVCCVTFEVMLTGGPDPYLIAVSADVGSSASSAAGGRALDDHLVSRGWVSYYCS